MEKKAYNTSQLLSVRIIRKNKMATGMWSGINHRRREQAKMTEEEIEAMKKSKRDYYHKKKKKK